MKNNTNDSVSDFLIRIKNGYLDRHKSIRAPYAKILAEISKILEKEKFIKESKAVTEEGRKVLLVTLTYPNRKPAITDITRVSKPGLRVYVPKKNIPRVYGGLGVAILSTPQGIMTGRDAAKKNVGGEVICKVW